jgi:hypothetical protein
MQLMTDLKSQLALARVQSDLAASVWEPCPTPEISSALILAYTMAQELLVALPPLMSSENSQ